MSELGRLAFAVQLALHHARTIFVYEAALPQRVYLDASVLMPAIISGHPLHPVYQPVLKRLQEQAASIGGRVQLATAVEFLNEIVTHRENARIEVQGRGLEDVEKLKREVRLFGAENLNVFIGAYAAHAGRAPRRMTFGAFLKEFAPFETEDALSKWLEKRGIEVVTLAPPAIKSHPPLRFWDWYNALHTAYATRAKPKVLVEHEAWQMRQLEEEHRQGIRSVFVTADARLRRAMADALDGGLADALLSGITMVSLVDLLLGVKIDHRGLARLLWGVHALDPEGKIRRYFTDRGLEIQGDVETMALPTIVDKITEEVVADPGAKDFLATSGEFDHAAVVDFLDRFQDRFYSLLEEAVAERQLKEERRLAETEHKRHNVSERMNKRPRRRNS